jgi:hypothetical protein
MAETVKRRVAAARLAVAFVAAGAIAGATAWAEAGPPPPTAQSSAADIFAKIKIDSSNVENGSLLYQDFKKAQVPSFKMWDKLDQSFFKFKKAKNHDISVIKGELGSVNGDISTIKGELGGYMKLSDADARYIKQGDAILGDGSVFTGDGFVANQLVGLLDVPGLINVQGIGSKIRITNTSGGDLQHTACVSPQGGTLAAGTLQDGGFIECDAKGGLAQSMQFFTGGVKPTVATINFSSIDLGGSGGAQDTVQILVGL